MPSFKTPKTLLDLSCEKYSQLVFSSIKYACSKQSTVVGNLDKKHYVKNCRRELTEMTGFEFKDENDDNTATLDIALLFDATTASKVHDNNIELNLEINDYLKTLPPRIVYQIIAKCQEIFIKEWTVQTKFGEDDYEKNKFIYKQASRFIVLPRMHCFYLSMIIPSVTHLDFTSLNEFGTYTPAAFKYFHQILDEILVKVPQLQHLNIKCQNSRTCLPSFATHHLRLLGQHCPYLKYLDISFHNGLKNEDLLFLTPDNNDNNKDCTNQNRPGCVFLETLYVFDCGFNDQTIKELVIHLTNLINLGYKEMGKVLKKLYKSGYYHEKNSDKLRFTHINNLGAKVRKTSVPGLRCKKNMINAIEKLCPRVTNLKVRVQDSDVQYLSCLKELRSVELVYNCGKPLTPALGTWQFIEERGTNLTSVALICATISMTHVNTLAKNCPNLVNLWLKSNFFQVSRGCREDLPEDMPMKHGYFQKLEILFFKVGEGELSLNFVPPYVFHYIVRNSSQRLKELTIALRSHIISDEYICGLLTEHNLIHLEKVLIVVPGLNNLPRVLSLTMQSVNFILDFCPKLKSLGNLRSWNIQGNDPQFDSIRDNLTMNNYDIKIICRNQTLH